MSNIKSGAVEGATIPARVKTLKVRVKDKHAKQLRGMANSVNMVFNYCNELSYRNITERKRYLSGYDIQKYLTGASKMLPIGRGTLDQIAAEYAIRRNKVKRSKLNWRKSVGTRRSLGWIPFKKRTVMYRNGQIYHNGILYSIWDSYGLSQYELRSGSFNEDARGRWYLNIVVEVKEEKSTGKESVGIDLGCKSTATDSNGYVVQGREFRKLEGKLGIAQRSRNKKQVKTIHAKIKNRRADTLHKYSRKLVEGNP